MFNTFRSQIFTLITVIMLITAATIMYFTYRDVGQAIMVREEASIQNISHFIQLNIKNDYDQLLYAKVDAIRHLKKKLKSLTSLCIAMHQAQAASKLAAIEKDSKGGNKKAHDVQLIKKQKKIDEIRRMARQWFGSPLLDKEINWLIYDENGQAVISSDDELSHLNIESFLDMKGRTVKQKLSSEVLSIGGEFAVFQLAGVKNEFESNEARGRWKLGFFMPLKKWHVTLSAIIDISGLVKMEESNIQRIIKNMQLDFADLKIAESGFVFVFDGQKNMLIPPEKKVAHYLSSPIDPLDPLTTRTYLDDFMEASRQAGKISYLGKITSESATRSNRQYAVYTTWFRGFDWYTAIVLPVEEIQQPATRLITRQSYIIAIIFLFSLLLCFFIVAKISRPLQSLTSQIKGVSSYDFATVNSEGLEKLLKALPVSSSNEAGRLAQSFGFMITELQANIRKLVETTASKERMESELNVAREIQLGSLPNKFDFEPEQKELEIYATLIPARETGGDLYDFFLIDDNHLCFTLGDVADKGVPAALFMVITKALVKITAQGNPSPAKMMGQINDILCQDNPNCMFVTLIIGILNIRTGEIRYANGGHNSPIFSDSGDGSYFKKKWSGPVPGVIPGVTFEEISIFLESGQAVFLYTDGVTEAMNKHDEVFSDDSLLEEFTALENESVAKVIAGVLQKVKIHVNTAPQSDDIAIMMIRWHKNDEPDPVVQLNK